MGHGDEWSPDEPMGTETFRQGDVAEDESERLSPTFREDLEGDPSLDPALVGDEVELREIGAQLDDPELLVTMEGGMDDPDGIGLRSTDRGADEGWVLNAALVETRQDEDEDEDDIDGEGGALGR